MVMTENNKRMAVECRMDAQHHHHIHNEQPHGQKMIFTDPVCGMSTDREGEFSRYDHEGQPYYFCSAHCLAQFKSNPGSFLAKEVGIPAADKEERSVPGRQYTCPMHPEILRDTPGSCPKCGMALEPRTASLEEEEGNPEYDYMRRRFIFAAILSVPLVVIAMRGMLPGGALIENLASPSESRLAGADAGDAGGALGRLGVLCAGRAIAAQ